jgi:hypothetical protein
MRLAVIDASPVGGGPIAHALSRAAAELPGASVVRVRTFDLFGRVCASCMACAPTGRCTRHHEVLDDAIARLASADALLVGCGGDFHAHDARCRALLERMVGAFGHVETARGLEGVRPVRRARKRAAMVCGAPPFMGVPAMLGLLPSSAAGVWRMLERADTAIVGCETVSTRWAGPASRDRAGESARRLGRSLAAPSSARVGEAPRRLDFRRVATALLGVVRGT